MAVIVVVMLMVMAVIMVMGMVVIPLETQQQGSRDLATLHGEHGNSWAKLTLELFRDAEDLGGLQAIGSADEDQICCLELVLEQLIDGREVIEAGIGQPLGLEGGGISNHATLCKGFTIHNGDDSSHTGAGADLRPVERLNQRLRQSQTAGFDDDAIELIRSLKQEFHGGQELVLHGAAKTAIGQLNNSVFKLIVRTEATAADQIPVDADFPELIHENGQFQAALEQEMAQQGGLASSEKSGHHGDGQTLSHRGVSGSGHQCGPGEGATHANQHASQQSDCRGWKKAAPTAQQKERNAEQEPLTEQQSEQIAGDGSWLPAEHRCTEHIAMQSERGHQHPTRQAIADHQADGDQGE